MRLRSEQIDEMFTQKSGSNPMCPSVCLEIRFFLTHLLEGQLCPISNTFLARQRHFRHPRRRPSEHRKEMIFDGRLANVRALVVRGIYCPSSQNVIKKALLEITVNSQGELNAFSRIVGSSVTPQLHVITSPYI